MVATSGQDEPNWARARPNLSRHREHCGGASESRQSRSRVLLERLASFASSGIAVWRSPRVCVHAGKKPSRLVDGGEKGTRVDRRHAESFRKRIDCSTLIGSGKSRMNGEKTWPRGRTFEFSGPRLKPTERSEPARHFRLRCNLLFCRERFTCFHVSVFHFPLD